VSEFITLNRTPVVSGTVRHLPTSKSLSNRALVIQALMKGAGDLVNLSDAHDTQLMKKLLNTPEDVIDAEDAGTVFRFLTAYLAISGHPCTLTGTKRMQQRPVGELVEALRMLGATIDYIGKEGYPPLRIGSFAGQKASTITIRGDISSQFISALMMVGPTLPRGLTVQLTGRIASRPYLEMTIALMNHFGVKATFKGTSIMVPPATYQPASYRVEPDWSAISYWCAFAALADKADLLLPGVVSDSLQGDRVVIDIMKDFGVKSSFEPGGLRLTGGGHVSREIKVDFQTCPDLAQTVLPVCAALRVKGVFTGIQSLRIKETDRIAALEAELSKVGALLVESYDIWTLNSESDGGLPEAVTIDTYGDHRMAMGFAPLATLMAVTIEDPLVVRKSYPGFWEDLKSVGLTPVRQS
jgi:3-phosphoshikimate 1-carboxyvinyltransferase